MYELKSYIESPKKYNILTKLKQLSYNEGLIFQGYSESLNRDIIDKILRIDRETIYFTIKGDQSKLLKVKNIIENLISDNS